jgi:hypothetical protein
LARALDGLLQDARLREQVGRRGREVLERFNIERISCE